VPSQALATGERIFTDFLARQASSRQEPEPDEIEEVLAALWKALRWELRRRGMWSRPPAYLGVIGLTSWAEAEWASPQSAPDPSRGLELVADCFRYVFVDRYPYLVRRLETHGDVEGLIYRNVRNFLHDRQQRCDPLGSRVYSLLRTAMREEVEAGRLHVLAGAPEIRNPTVLGIKPGGGPPEAGREVVEELAGIWADRLLPEIVTARGRRQQAVKQVVGELLGELPRRGVESFRFGDLVAPLIREIRARWGAVLEMDQGPTAVEGEDPHAGDEALPHVVRWIAPDIRFEEREDFRRLAECVRRGVESHEATPETRRHLEALWRWLAAHAAERDPTEAPLPSNRRLASELGIPRNRLPELYSILGEITETCRRHLASGAATVSPWAAASARGESADDRATILASLGRELAAARDRHVAQESYQPSTGEVAQFRRPPRRGRLSTASRTVALAASVLLALGLGFFAGRMLGPQPVPGGVVVNPPLVTFHAGEEVRSPSRTVTLAPEDTLLLLLFAVGDPGSTYRLEISHVETGETIWSGSAPATGLGELSVGVPTDRLAAGDYQLRLFRETEDGAESVGDFGLTIERP